MAGKASSHKNPSQTILKMCIPSDPAESKGKTRWSEEEGTYFFEGTLDNCMQY